MGEFGGSMVKIIVALVVILALIVGGVFYILQPNTLPLPSLEENPPGVAQSTLNDVRIADPRWLSKDGKLLWVVCRFGEKGRIRSNLLIDIDQKTTLRNLRGAYLVSWVNDREILVYNQGKTDSEWDKFRNLLDQETPGTTLTQFHRIDVFSGNRTQVCELRSAKALTFVDPSPDGRRVVLTFGPQETYEFESSPNSIPAKVTEEYVWSPTWIDNDTYLFVGETSVLSRKFGSDESKSVSVPLLKEVREAIADYGSPTVRISGKVGENLLLVDHNPELDFDSLLVVDQKTTLVEEVTRLVSSPELPRFNEDGDMFVYQGQQFDRNMDSVYLQKVEVDSQPIELIEGEFGSVQESTPLFRNPETVLFVHRGIEVRSISLSDGEIQLHWPIAVVP